MALSNSPSDENDEDNHPLTQWPDRRQATDKLDDVVHLDDSDDGEGNDGEPRNQGAGGTARTANDQPTAAIQRTYNTRI